MNFERAKYGSSEVVRIIWSSAREIIHAKESLNIIIKNEKLAGNEKYYERFMTLLKASAKNTFRDYKYHDGKFVTHIYDNNFISVVYVLTIALGEYKIEETENV